MLININIEIDPNDIAEEIPNTDIEEFILDTVKALDNEDFTLSLIFDLLKTIDISESDIQKIYDIIYNT